MFHVKHRETDWKTFGNAPEFDLAAHPETCPEPVCVCGPPERFSY